MKGQRPLTTMKLFDGVAIAKNGTESSVAIDLREIAQNGLFSIQSIMAGTGTLKLEYLLSSTENGNYIEPDAASDIVAAQRGLGAVKRRLEATSEVSRRTGRD